MRAEITEDQITELMRAIPRAEEVDRLRGEVEKLTRERDEARADVDRLRGDREKMLLDERDFVRKHRAEIERLTRERDEARDVVARQRARRKLRLLEMKP